MSALSDKVFRSMEDDRIDDALRCALMGAGTVNLGVIYAAAEVRSPEWMRAHLLSAARDVDPEATQELDKYAATTHNYPPADPADMGLKASDFT